MFPRFPRFRRLRLRLQQHRRVVLRFGTFWNARKNVAKCIRSTAKWFHLPNARHVHKTSKSVNSFAWQARHAFVKARANEVVPWFVPERFFYAKVATAALTRQRHN